MKFNMISWASLAPVVKETFIRFPLPFIFAFCATFIALFLVHDIEIVDEEFIGKSFTSLFYGAVALTSFKLLVESKEWPFAKQAIGTVVIIAIIIIYVWLILDESTPSSYMFFSLAVVISLLFAPYIARPADSSSVWYFNYQTGVAVFFAGFAALILGVGMTLILVSIGYLFEIKIPYKIYSDIWVLSWGVLYPIYILANISSKFDFEEEGCNFPKGVSFITNYLLVPLMFVYMAILYVYFFKIIIQWELPRGNLGWMITIFGTAGITTKLLAYPIRSNGTRLLVLFDRYYYYVLIVPILLLAVAIGVRISNYGMTEQRYAVLLLGVWFSVVTLTVIIKKDLFQIKYVPIILAVLAILASFGPWGAVEVSANSQAGRFKSLLVKHDLLVDGQAVKAKVELSFADRKSISSIADYLSKNEYRLRRIRPLFKTLMSKAEKKEVQACRRKCGKDFVELLGVSYVSRWKKEEAADSFNYNNIFDLNKMLADVSSFDYVGHNSFYLYRKEKAENIFSIDLNGKHEVIKVGYEGGLLTIKTKAGERVVFDLDDFIRGLRKQNITQITQANLDRLTLTKSSAKRRLRARLLFEQIKGKVAEGNEIKITSMRFVLMLKFNS